MTTTVNKIIEATKLLDTMKVPNNDRMITDGFGNYWGERCHVCGAKKQIVRPGKIQCECEGGNK